MAIIAQRGGSFLSDMKGIGCIWLGNKHPRKHDGRSMAAALKFGYWTEDLEEGPALEAAREYERKVCHELGITEKAPW